MHLESVLCERGNLQILTPDAPAPPSVRVLEILAADNLGVLARLVCGEVRDESTIAERCGIAIEHKHAAGATRKRKQLAHSTVAVDVVGKRTADGNPIAPTDRRRERVKRSNVSSAARPRSARV
jgi:hypothetical protein